MYIMCVYIHVFVCVCTHTHTHTHTHTYTHTHTHTHTHTRPLREDSILGAIRRTIREVETILHQVEPVLRG